MGDFYTSICCIRQIGDNLLKQQGEVWKNCHGSWGRSQSEPWQFFHTSPSCFSRSCILSLPYPYCNYMEKMVYTNKSYSHSECMICLTPTPLVIVVSDVSQNNSTQREWESNKSYTQSKCMICLTPTLSVKLAYLTYLTYGNSLLNPPLFIPL